jgi:hypothetical protein
MCLWCIIITEIVVLVLLLVLWKLSLKC